MAYLQMSRKRIEVLARLNNPDYPREKRLRPRKLKPLAVPVLTEPWKPKAAASRPVSAMYRPLWFLSNNLQAEGFQDQP